MKRQHSIHREQYIQPKGRLTGLFGHRLYFIPGVLAPEYVKLSAKNTHFPMSTSMVHFELSASLIRTSTHTLETRRQQRGTNEKDCEGDLEPTHHVYKVEANFECFVLFQQGEDRPSNTDSGSYRLT